MTEQGSAIEPAKIEAVAALLAQSEKGRALLDGLTASRRGSELKQLFTQMERLEDDARRAWHVQRDAALDERLQTMAGDLSRARADIADIKVQLAPAPRLSRNAGHLTSLARSSAWQISTLLNTARRLRIIVQGLREAGIDERLCIMIDQEVTHTLIATETSELTAGKLRRMADLLGRLEDGMADLSRKNASHHDHKGDLHRGTEAD